MQSKHPGAVGFANYAKPLHPFGGLYSDAFNTPLGLMDPFICTSQGVPTGLLSAMAIGSARNGHQVQGLGAMGRQGSVYGQPFGESRPTAARFLMLIIRIMTGHPLPLIAAYSRMNEF